MTRLLPLAFVIVVCLIVFVVPMVGVIGVGLGVGYVLNHFVPAIDVGPAAIIGVLGSLSGFHTLIRVVEILSESFPGGMENENGDEDPPSVVVPDRLATLIQQSDEREPARPKMLQRNTRGRQQPNRKPDN